MKNIVIVSMITVLILNTIFLIDVKASANYDHNELLDYPGYGEAMYESIVEQTTFISGRYTENKDYVNESINQVTDYARGWWDEYMRISELPPKEKIREMINAGGGYLLTVGDFIKNLFTDYDDSIPSNDIPDYSGYEVAFSMSSNSTMSVNDGYTAYLIVGSQRYKAGKNDAIFITHTGSELYKYYKWHLYFKSNSIASTPAIYVDHRSEVWKARDESYEFRKTVAGTIAHINIIGVGLEVWKDGKIQNIGDGTSTVKPSRDIKNYINESNPQIVTPQPKAYLSCPDGTRINMKINGGTFLDVKGNIMSVDKNGTATIDSQICNLGWEKPDIRYIEGDDNTDRVAITTPDGDVIDGETGEIITGGNNDEDFDDEIKDGCGTICAIGKLLTGMGSIAKSIAAIPLKILDGLFELIKKILVPPENYFSEQMDALKKKFFNEEIEKGLESIEQLSSGGGGTFEDVNVSLMGVDNVKVVDSTSVNKTLDTFHSWVRGVFYPLLLFFNINMLYRLIRGTTLVGIGRVGKGGGEN